MCHLMLKSHVFCFGTWFLPYRQPALSRWPLEKKLKDRDKRNSIKMQYTGKAHTTMNYLEKPLKMKPFMQIVLHITIFSSYKCYSFFIRTCFQYITTIFLMELWYTYVTHLTSFLHLLVPLSSSPSIS